MRPIKLLVALTVVVSVAGARPANADEPLRGDAAITVGLAGCSAGDATHCRETAGLMEQRRVSSRNGQTPTTLRARAEKLIEQQCTAGDGTACFQQGEPLARRGTKKDAARGRTIIERACTLRNGDACLYLAHHAKNARKALELFELACSHDSAQACEQLALRLRGRDRARSAELHHKACVGDDMSGCLHSGELRLANNDRDGAATEFEAACDLGDMPTCDRAGALTKDPVRARELFKRACDAEVANGCAHLADFVATGKGGERHWGNGIDLAEQACWLARQSRCTQAEQLRKHPPDATCSSVTDCRRLCDERVGASCARLAPMLGVAERERVYIAACDNGDGASCAVLGDAEADADSAMMMYQRGCKLGDARSCTYVRFTAVRSGSRPARDALRKACASDIDACVLLGLAIEAKDVKSAKQLWLDACTREPGPACRLAAYGVARAFEGRGPLCWTGNSRTDECFAETKQLLTKACDAKNREGCRLLQGQFYGSEDDTALVELPVATPRWQ